MKKRNVILRDSSGVIVDNGKTVHRGIEYEIAWQLLPTLRLSGGGTYARHQYDFSRSVSGGDNILKGNDIDTAPRHLHRAALWWQPLPALTTELEWQHVGQYWLDASNRHDYPGHDLLNLRAAWEFAPRWRLGMRLNNLLDQRYADRADYAFGSYRYFPGQGRALFLDFTWIR